MSNQTKQHNNIKSHEDQQSNNSSYLLKMFDKNYVLNMNINDLISNISNDINYNNVIGYKILQEYYKEKSNKIKNNSINAINTINNQEEHKLKVITKQVPKKENILLKNLLIGLEKNQHLIDEEQLEYHDKKQKLIYYLENIYFEDAVKILQSNIRLSTEFVKNNHKQNKFLLLQDKIYQEFIYRVFNETGFEDRSTKDTKILFKQDKDGLAIIKFSKVIKCKLINFLKLIYECDYYPKWFPFMKSAKSILTVGVGQKMVYMENSFPFFSNREFLIYGFGINKFEQHKKVYVLTKSIDDEEGFDELNSTHRNKSNVRAYLKIFGWEIEYIDDNTIKLLGLIGIDPKMGYIPNSVINFALKKMTVDIFDEMLKLLKDYENCVAYNKNPSGIDKKLYDLLEKTIK